MKTQSTLLTNLSLHENPRVNSHRYQIYREARAGNFMLEQNTDSPDQAVELFAIMSPAYDGGEVHIWDAHQQCVGASVEWQGEETAFGFSVKKRRNVFLDPTLAMIAHDQAERQIMRESILSSLRQSA